ncbi:HD domain-containing protein [Sporosarcina sp. Te-1]|uniref:HD domain-containing protein n=1 Tax=Sporosarcina sp. Te-1 TaxID=2818390 RepID=UPI001A9D4226|nr:HD domain-containing protein [Sporosarcina sp. Te-1]QTD42128.1 HD domain-containing protein [Sporosarcina sp. Te-1]
MEQLLLKCEQKVHRIYEEFDASHDFDHIERVMRNAKAICQTIPEADTIIVQLAVLLHDIDDPKYRTADSQTPKDLLTSIGADFETIQRVIDAIDSVSFSGGQSKELKSIEGAIVRDADRLDAIGAIGIARTFAFGGAKGRKLYDKTETARLSMTEEEYRTKETASVTHFYEKLLLLKELMVTEEGKRLAEERHAFMVEFLAQLDREVGLEL